MSSFFGEHADEFLRESRTLLGPGQRPSPSRLTCTHIAKGPARPFSCCSGLRPGYSADGSCGSVIPTDRRGEQLIDELPAIGFLQIGR